MTLFGDPTVWLPLAFAALMGISILVYVVLDGFDLGVGILLPLADEDEKDRMIAAIGPFWDANETWLVLAVGLLLVAFPVAHGVILTALYLPVAVMLIGLILRGVAFEFRAKTSGKQKLRWNQAFFAGSLSASLAQGYMLGLYIMGLEHTPATIGFGILTAACLTAGYGLIGAAWLIYKCEDVLQLKAIRWARTRLWGVVMGFAAISLASPLVSERIFDKWFSFPSMILLAPLPLMAGLMLFILWTTLQHLPARNDKWSWVPFAATSSLFVLAFSGLAYSFYPYVVPERLTLYESASAPESLFIILIGAVFVLPVIIGYTILAYTVFRGKATELRYD
ncbi:cytochrome bd ubiquinol oxidase subunit II [Roseibium aquae]|uniref:Cytochrome bd ubiquinol oxidase subunit II n=1 Tax=Roseibium aquae TaxID=1323746 RepID=A0A916TLQ5_9HYPH|nr:cytochrome d ubiquinol oxidase subunit II [Roseibium aquae]GGB53948.1 cytochrome bd ubiquinol oxidase subunit II [Roseibium aquae]